MALLKATIKMTIRNKQVLFWTLFFPLMMMLMFGAMFSGGDRQYDVGLVNKSNSKMSKELVKVIKKVEAFKISEKSEKTEKDALENGKKVAVIIIPSSLKDINKPRIDNTNPQSPSNNTGPLKSRGQSNPPMKIEAIKSTKIEFLYNENKGQDAQIVATVASQITGRFNQQITGAKEIITMGKKAYKSKNLKYIDFLLPGLIAMSLMMGGVVGIATSIATLRERGVLKSLLLTPMKPANFFASQIITRFTMALIQTIIMITLGIFVYGLHFSGNVINLAIVVILGATVFLIFGLLMSGIAKSAETVEPMSRAITMPMIFLSGVFFPVDVMPKWLQPISKSMPLYYMADALRKVIADGASLSAIKGSIFVLLVWGSVGFVLALITFKWE